jgi:phenylacetaldehyde dehydrogenase
MQSAAGKAPALRHFIGNEFREAETRPQVLFNPSDQSPLGNQAGASPRDIDAALRCAESCHRSGDWSGLGAKRADFLDQIASRLEPEVDALALLESANTGVVLSHTRMLLGLLPAIFRGAAEQVRRHPDRELLDARRPVELWHKPWGPALCLAPWNSPAPIGAHKLASALAAGAPAILKPSEFTPFTTQRLFEIIAASGLPAGAAQLVHGAGAEGARLAADPRIKAVSFTGGLRSGRAVAGLCAQDLKPVQLELGGHNPLVVLPDAKLEAVLDGLVTGLTTLNGQWCRAVGRVFVPTAMRDALISGFLRRIEQLVIGPATALGSQMGPLVHREHKSHLLDILATMERLGATRHSLVSSYERDSCFFLPELVSGLKLEDDHTEIFGPVAVVHAYDRLEDLTATVNDSPFGLAAYIYGSDQERMLRMARELNFGSTKLNGVSLTSLSPHAPRSAWGISGLGEEGSFETFRFFQGSCVLGSVNEG